MSDTSGRRLPLDRLHARLGAEWRRQGEWRVPAHYGDVSREIAALHDGCGLVDRSWIDRLEIVGADRQRFLNGYLTCDVKALAAGSGAYGFFTEFKGRVLADTTVLALADRLWLELPPGRGAAVREHLGRYILADRVELLSLADMLPLTLAGPRVESVLAAVELPAEPGGHRRAMVDGTEVHLAREWRFGAPAVTLWTSSSLAKPFTEALLERSGVEPVGFEACEVLRVEAGLGRYGQDFGEENFPQETGAEDDAVSYTKGCYLGQEVVARIHYRGGVQRRLRGLEFEAAPPAVGTTVLAEGREVGVVTSAVVSPRFGALGLAVLHQRAGETGARVELSTGEAAKLAELPWHRATPPAS